MLVVLELLGIIVSKQKIELQNNMNPTKIYLAHVLKIK